MSVRFSYGDFTTRGHGVIEYADPYSNQDGQKKRKRRSKVNPKLVTRWPSAAPLKLKASTSKPVIKKSVEKQAWDVFKQRHPGQQPKKGQMKLIMQELRIMAQQSKGNNSKTGAKANSQSPKPQPENKIDTLTLAMFKRRYPGQQPNKDKLKDIRQELVDARRKLGL